MKFLTADEKAYLRLAYYNGCRYIATDKDNKTFFYSEKPAKEFDCWMADSWNNMKSLANFGTSFKDEEPTKILDILTSNKCKSNKYMSDNTKEYIVSLCNYIDWLLSIVFIILLIRCLLYTGDGWGYTLGAFVSVLVWPNKKYWAEWLGVE